MRWRWIVLLLVLAAIGMGAAFSTRAATAMAEWLVVEDPLSKAPAIVILNGYFPFRAMEAASLYKQGWAKEVWLIRASPTHAEEQALEQLGMQIDREEAINREVLARSQVPANAICVLNGKVKNTADEMRLIAHELAQRGKDRVIIVTSKAHSRRVRATWRALVGNQPCAIVRYAVTDPYSSTRWWRNTNAALVVSREIFGLINVWAGFPVR
jgi:uncharacterized SAM-binding protein YcdF (DUF218 family)